MTAPKKQILCDISLSFYYGAKIDVFGRHSAGKPTLLNIIAGIDKDYIGEILQAKGYTVNNEWNRREPSLSRMAKEKGLPAVRRAVFYEKGGDYFTHDNNHYLA